MVYDLTGRLSDAPLFTFFPSETLYADDYRSPFSGAAATTLRSARDFILYKVWLTGIDPRFRGVFIHIRRNRHNLSVGF